VAHLAADVLTTLQTAVETGILSGDVEDAIILAADLLGKARCPHYQSGIPKVDAAAVTQAEGRQLEQALLGFLRRHPQSELTRSLIWALGKSNDPAHTGEFVAQLERGVRMLVEGNGLVFQALCCLDNVGQDVFEKDERERSSQSLTDVEKNLRQARAYLAKRGVQVPW
jgi:hypothetical protein